MDVAALGLEVGSDGVVKASERLNKFTTAANDAGTSADRVGAASKRTERDVSQMSRSVQQAESAMRAMAKVAAVLGVAAIARDIIQTNAAFQSLEASLKIATGSVSAASAEMERLKAFAAETPYALEQSVQAFLKLKNLGLDPSIEAMRSYGNTASSMGKDLMQMIEAVADASTGEFERLKEFGIKASQAGDQVAFTFQGVTTTVSKSSAEIEKYLQKIGNVQFAGAMAEQMKTLNGQWANLQDNIDALYVAIGKLGANNALVTLMSGASEAVAFLSANLDTIVNVLGAAATGFVSYQAALLASSAATKIMTSSLVAQSVAAMTAGGSIGVLGRAQVILTASAAGAAAGIKTLTVAMLANPAVWLAAAITGVVMVFKSLSDASRDAEVRLAANAAAADVLGISLSKASQEALKAAQETKGVGTSASASEPLIWSFKNATDNLTNSLWEQAKAARSARVEMLRSQLEAAKTREKEAMGQTRGGAINEFHSAGASFRQGDLLAGFPKLGGSIMSGVRDLLSNGRTSKEASRDFADSARIAIEAKKQLDKALSTPIGAGDLPKTLNAAGAGATALAGGLKKVGGAAPAAAKGISDTAKEAEKFTLSLADLINGLTQYQLDMTETMKPVVDGLNAALDEKIKAANDNAYEALEASAKSAADANQTWNDELRATVALLDQIGGAATGLGDIAAAMYGLKTGDFSGVRGPAGALMQQLGAIQWRDRATDKDGLGQIRILREEVSRFLEGVEIFGTNASALLQGATTGAAVGNVAGFTSTGGQIGSMVGGAIGQEVGKQVLTGVLGKLGGAAGPLGAIAGALVGGLVGNLFKQAKSKANVITEAGQAGTFGGTGGDYTRAADALSKSVLSSLDKLAEALGATADGAFKLSIGMRDGNFVVNPNGGGTKSSMGAVNFGKDEAGAIAFAIQDAISDGVFKGLGEGVERLLKSGGDLETQLQKALSFKGVFDELDKMRDPQAFDMKALDSWRAGMDKLFAEAGATSQQLADLEELTGLKRKEIVEKYATDTVEAERRVRTMQAELLRLQGDDQGALNMVRALEREQLTATEAALYDQINALSDAAEAAASVRAIQIQIMEAEGRTAEAEAAKRADALAAASAGMRPWIEALHTATDAATAAAKAQDLANTSRQLDIRLAEALGNTAQATQMKMEDFINSFDVPLRPKAQQVWDAEQAAGAPKSRLQQLNDARANLSAAQSVMDAVGGFADKFEWKRLDPSGYQKAFDEFSTAWDTLYTPRNKPKPESDLIENVARQKAAEMKAANDNYISSLDQQVSALNETIDSFTRFRDALKGFRTELFDRDLIAGNAGALQSKFFKTAGLAGQGNAAAYEALPGIGREYADMIKASSGSRLEEQRALIGIADALEPGIATADRTINLAQQQVDHLADIKAGINSLNERVDRMDKNNQAGQVTIAANTRETSKTLKDVTDDGFGMRNQEAA